MVARERLGADPHRPVSGSVVTVDSLGPDANLGFAPLQWVEISDDSYEFGQVPNQPGQLRQIKTVDFEHRQITLTSPRRRWTRERPRQAAAWDHTDADATASGIRWHPEAGTPGERHPRAVLRRRPFVAGDFWLIPARTATGALEWPPCASDGADFQPRSTTPASIARRSPASTSTRSRRLRAGRLPRLLLPAHRAARRPPRRRAARQRVNWPNDDIIALDQIAFRPGRHPRRAAGRGRRRELHRQLETRQRRCTASSSPRGRRRIGHPALRLHPGRNGGANGNDLVWSAGTLPSASCMAGYRRCWRTWSTGVFSARGWRSRDARSAAPARWRPVCSMARVSACRRRAPTGRRRASI